MTTLDTLTKRVEELSAEVEKLKEREASWENALQCLEAYLSQFPNQMLLRQMIQVWFSDVKEG